MRGILFSDLHISSGSKIEKLEDCLKCLEWIYQEAVDRKISYIFFAGDLFHDRQKINIYAYDRTYEILQKYSKQIKSYYILGNHDIFFKTKRSVSSVNPFSEIINVIKEPCTLEIDDLKIDFLPYTENIKTEIKNTGSDILIGHLALSGAVLNSSHNITYRDSEIVEQIQETPKELLQRYKKVFLGHFHARQQVDKKIEYIGSPLQLSYGEAFDKKGFTILDFKTLKTEFVENNFTPKYLILSIKENLADYDLKNNYVRIISSQLSSINEIDLKNEIEEKFLPKELEIIHSSSEEEKQKTNQGLNNIENIYQNINETIKQYVNISETELEKSKLIDIGIEISKNDN